jgi:carbohydrate kinase (thermoresistant glucokinase family)
MGVAGSGKTTIGRGLAEAMAARFIDADDYHRRQNIEKMSRGEALTDTDREPWLEALRGVVRGVLERDEQAILGLDRRTLYRKVAELEQRGSRAERSSGDT